MFKGMNIGQWIAVAVGAAVAVHALGIFDMTTAPIVGPLFAKFLTPHAKKVNSKVVTLASATDNLVQDERCEQLKINLLALRHFSSERPKDKAVELLAACDTLQAELDAYHESHAT